MEELCVYVKICSDTRYTMVLAMGSVLMNQQHRVNRMSTKRNSNPGWECSTVGYVNA